MSRLRHIPHGLPQGTSLLLVFLVLVSGGCGSGMASSSVPSMIEVADVQPREVEVGDRIEILGAGFPLRRTAHVLLRGVVHRPGLDAESVSIPIDAESRSEGRLEIPISPQLADRIVGAGDLATHATFRGEVLVSFAPAESGTASLTGKASEIVLDVRPDRPARAPIAHREESAGKLLDFLGIAIAPSAPASGGLVVTSVRAGSPSALAGIEARDVLVDFEGVSVAALADLVATSEVARIGVRREGEAKVRLLVVPLAGYSQRIPRSMMAAAILVAIASVLVMLGASRPTARRAFVERAIAERFGLGARAWVKEALPQIALVAAVAPLLPIAQMLGIDLDVGALLCIAAAALLALSLAASPARDARSSWAIARDQLPAALAAVAVVIATGSLRLDDVLRAQGALPWDWFAFRTPATALLVASWLSAAAPSSTARGRKTELSEDAALVATSMLVATLFLGGWRIPGLEHRSDAIGRLHRVETIESFQLLAALAFAVKAASVAALLRVLSTVLPPAANGALHPTWRVRLPLSALGLGATIALGATSLSPGVLRVLGLGTFVGCAALAAFALVRAASSVRTIGVRHLDPSI